MKTAGYAEFWQKMHGLAGSQRLPLRVMFELTYRCNFRCQHCYVPVSYVKKYRSRELSTKQVFEFLLQLKDAGCLYLGFTGGEIFCRRDVLPILSHAKKLGFQIIIYTNGSLIDEKTADAIAKIAPNKVDITIPGMSAQVFEHITGVAGSKDKVFAAIEFLKRRKIPLGFKTCLLKANKAEITEIKEFACARGNWRLDDTISPCLDGSKKPYRFRVSSKKNPSIGKKTGYFCGAGSQQVAITPAGEMKLCVSIDQPKLLIMKSSFAQCWQRLKKMVDSPVRDRRLQCPLLS